MICHHCRSPLEPSRAYTCPLCGSGYDGFGKPSRTCGNCYVVLAEINILHKNLTNWIATHQERTNG